MAEQELRLINVAIQDIAAYEGKNVAEVEDELGQKIGVAPTTIQRWRSTGQIPPTNLRAIEIVAKETVSRTLLRREWLTSFLKTTAYHKSEKLIEDLCPTLSESPPPPSNHNMPGPTYSHFIQRQQVFDDVMDGLRQRSSAVIIVGLGGMGKTSLVREVAASCLTGNPDLPRFDKVVWISDKDRPGTTTLDVVLNDISRLLGYSFGQRQFDDKRRSIEQVLRHQYVLIVVDSFETITDIALLTWLLRLPEPSKALLTSREYRREFRQGGWSVELHGMDERESFLFMQQRLRFLHIDNHLHQSHLKQLFTATGGNPKALEIALGCIKHAHQQFQEILDDLAAARNLEGLFDDLFARAWGLLDEHSRYLLISTPLFLQSMSARALMDVSGVHGVVFNQAIEQLVELALIDVQHTDVDIGPRYTVHPLVYAFASAKLRCDSDFERVARERWVKWYVDLSSQVGYCWNNLKQLNLLDPEQDTLYEVIQWAHSKDLFEDVLELAKGSAYYYHTRGFGDRQIAVDIMRAHAAHELNKAPEELQALSYLVQVFSKQGRLDKSKVYIDRLSELERSIPLSGDLSFYTQHAIALDFMIRGALLAAEQTWCKSLKQSEGCSPNLRVANRQWYAYSLYLQGKHAEAEAVFRVALEEAETCHYMLGIIVIQVKLATIALDHDQIGSAQKLLEKSRKLAMDYQETGSIAEILRLDARIHIHNGNLADACQSLYKAAELFERMGMERELAETQAALTTLNC